MSQVLTNTVQTSGWKSLYTVRQLCPILGYFLIRYSQGLSAALLRQMTYSLVRLGTYASIKTWISGGSLSPT